MHGTLWGGLARRSLVPALGKERAMPGEGPEGAALDR